MRTVSGDAELYNCANLQGEATGAVASNLVKQVSRRRREEAEEAVATLPPFDAELAEALVTQPQALSALTVETVTTVFFAIQLIPSTSAALLGSTWASSGLHLDSTWTLGRHCAKDGCRIAGLWPHSATL